jgi:hypothetical protein
MPKQINITSLLDFEIEQMFSHLEIDKWFLKDRLNNFASITGEELYKLILKSDSLRQQYIVRTFTNKINKEDKILFFTFLAKIYSFPEMDDRKVKVINISIKEN